MKQGRMHAYKVLLRVAQVREIRASIALAEASTEKHAHQTHHDGIAAARDVVTAASRTSAADTSSLDMARYEMLSNLDAMFAQRLHSASQVLASAEEVCHERATASVVAKRYREQIDERVKEIGNAMEQERSVGRQEEAIELWLKGESTMSDIGQIDTAFYAKRTAAERSPAQDFAQELAKAGADKVVDSTHNHAAMDQPMRAVATTPQPSVDVSHMTYASSWTPAGMASNVATQEQLSVAVLPTGITEALLGSRVYGVHLLASTYLSELATRGDSDPEVLSDTTLPMTESTPPQPHAVVSDVLPDLSGAIHDASLHEEVVAGLNLLMKGEADEVLPHTQSSSSDAIASMQASTMLWPESSLRITRQRDGSAVIWLRDYRMLNEGASQVMDMLTKGAEAAGIRLGRIVLNGREVWTSPQNY